MPHPPNLADEPVTRRRRRVGEHEHGRPIAWPQLDEHLLPWPDSMVASRPNKAAMASVRGLGKHGAAGRASSPITYWNSARKLLGKYLGHRLRWRASFSSAFVDWFLMPFFLSCCLVSLISFQLGRGQASTAAGARRCWCGSVAAASEATTAGGIRG